MIYQEILCGAMQHGRGTVQHIGRGSYRKWDASSDRSAVLGKCCGSEEKLYSINTPLTTFNLRIRANPAFQKTLINTVDAYVICFQTTFNFPSCTSCVRSPSPALSRNKNIVGFCVHFTQVRSAFSLRPRVFRFGRSAGSVDDCQPPPRAL
jgi:hypothetical protein